MVLLVIREIHFHLRRIHPTVRLRHINGRCTELREDVDLHLSDRHDGRRGDRNDWTMIVIGRRIAVSTSHITFLLEALLRDHIDQPESRLSQLVDERCEITARVRRGQQRPPYAEARDGIVGFGLRQQALRFRNFGEVAQAA